MRSLLLHSIVVAMGLLQSLTPFRVGDVAQQLTAQDVVEIEDAASAAGSAPWLLVGVQGQVVGIQSIATYLPPETATNDLRRGRMVQMVRVLPQAAGFTRFRLGIWTVARTGTYAQVRLADRNVERTVDDRDVNLPFEVSGDFDDVELVSLVRFLRSSPIGPTPNQRTDWARSRRLADSTGSSAGNIDRH